MYVLFDNLWHQVQTILRGRSNRLKGFALIGLGYDIGTQALNGVQRVGHSRRVSRV